MFTYIMNFLHIFSAKLSAVRKRWYVGQCEMRCAYDWPSYVGVTWATDLLDEAVVDQFHTKQGRTIGRRLFFHGDNVLITYIKIHYKFSLFLRLVAFFFPDKYWSHALREWKWLCWGLSHGWPVPRPLAAAQWIGPKLHMSSVLVIEELRDMVPLHIAIPRAISRHSDATLVQWKRFLLSELARLVSLLHMSNIYHKDLYSCHFFIKDNYITEIEQNLYNKLYLIDFHRMSYHRLTRIWWQSKDLAQLFFSLLCDGLTRQDIDYLWNTYVQLMNVGKFNKVVLHYLIRIKTYLYYRHHRRQRR